MEQIKFATSTDIIITDDKQYAVGLLYDSSIADAPVISIKINGDDLNEALDYFKSYNITIFYIHWLAKYMYENYALKDTLIEKDYPDIAKLYAKTPKFRSYPKENNLCH